MHGKVNEQFGPCLSPSRGIGALIPLSKGPYFPESGSIPYLYYSSYCYGILSLVDLSPYSIYKEGDF